MGAPKSRRKGAITAIFAILILIAITVAGWIFFGDYIMAILGGRMQTPAAVSGAKVKVDSAVAYSYKSMWKYKRPITITNSGSALSNFQICIDVPYDDDMNLDFSDIRFRDANGVDLPYWIESYTAGSSATVWVKVTSIPNGTSTIYMYYGNPHATSASSIAATMEHGILLVTKYQVDEGYADDHDELVKFVENGEYRSGWWGWSTVDSINHDQNIHGNDDRYVSYYECWFYVPSDKAGPWSFATDSDDASEIEIDGTVVVGWYGGHAPAYNWSHNGSIDLSAGWHKLIYRQQEWYGIQLSKAGAKASGEADYSVFGTSYLSDIYSRKFTEAAITTSIGNEVQEYMYSNEIVVSLRNLSNTEVEVADAYVTSPQGITQHFTANDLTFDDGSPVIKPGGVKRITIVPTEFTLTTGQKYSGKIVLKGGIQAIFSVTPS